MDGCTSEELKRSWAWASHDEMDMTTMQLPEFSAYTDYEAADLPVPVPELCGATPGSRPVTHMIEKPHVANWSSVPSTSTMCLSNPTPQAQALSEKGKNSMREMIFKIAAMQPVHIDPESVKPPKRRNVKISKDPQSVAARHRRERISERIRILQRLVPGGTKMDTASMLDEAIHYLKFLKSQVHSLQRAASNTPPFPLLMSCANFTPNYLSMHKPYQPPSHNPHHYYGDA